MEFVKDCLNVKMTLQDVATKYGMTMDELVERYQQERAKYTDAEFNKIMSEPTMKNPKTCYEAREFAFEKVMELGLTANELVELTGLSKATIRKFLKGELVFGSINHIWDTVKVM